MLIEHKAKRIAFFNYADHAIVVFDPDRRRIKIELPLPLKIHYLKVPAGNKRSSAAVEKAFTKAINQRLDSAGSRD